MRMNFSIPVVALIAGTAIGFALRPAGTSKDAAPPQEAPHQAKYAADAGADASNAALRSRIKELEKLLAEAESARAAAERAPAAAPVREEAGRGARAGFRHFREEMEQLKTDDPERYTHMTNRFAAMRRRRGDEARSRLEFFSSLDLSGMDEKARNTHARLIGAIAKRDKLEEALHAQNATDEEREQAMQEIFAADRELRQLNREERDNLIAAVIREIGLSGDDAENATAVFSEIIQATENASRPPRPPRD